MENFEKKSPEISIEQEKPRFEYSPENPPPLEVLESKVFAVHATSILPESGLLKASARDIHENKKWNGNEPPSFRPTLHFALGELVQGHSLWKWEGNPYAIVSPLKNLEGQLINVFPHDTFVLGDLLLQEGMILLVPKDTDISKISQGIEIKEYDPKVGLRMAVDSIISEKQGWHIQMKPEGVAIGSVAYIEGVEINDPKFFQSLFEKYPHISFGTHINPERGDAFRFGIIDQTIQSSIQDYFSYRSRRSTTEVSFNRSLIVHNLQRLEQAIENSSINPQALQTFEEKKEKLLGWLNIIDCDLETRQRLGKTFLGASESVQMIVLARRDSPAKLREFVDQIYLELPDAVQESEMSPTLLAELLCGMSPQELKQFKTDNEAAFANVSLPEFYSHYAAKRWIIVKNEQAQNEELDQLLVNSLGQLAAKPKERDGVFGTLKEFLNEESNRLETALVILRNPAVKKHLAEVYGINFDEGGPMNLREVIVAHPETRILFESQELSLSDEQREAYQFLDVIGQIHKPRIELENVLHNFIEASCLAFEVKWSRDILHQNLETISKPMNIVRSLDNLESRTTLILYEVLRRDKKPLEIWSKVGLEKEYRKRFRTDSVFWNSDLSLIEIYRMLKAEHRTTK